MNNKTNWKISDKNGNTVTCIDPKPPFQESNGTAANLDVESRKAMYKYALNDIFGARSLVHQRFCRIDKVIFNDPATIVFWRDGTKTVVKAINEPYDPEKGMAMACARKLFGNKWNYYNIFKKWLPKDDPLG